MSAKSCTILFRIPSLGRVLVLLSLTTAAGLAAAFAQADEPTTSGGRVDVTQVDITRFPEVTVFCRVLGPDGKKLPTVRQEWLEILEEGKASAVTGFRGYGDFETRTILLVDTSGSMSEAVPDGRSKIEAARAAIGAFCDVCRAQDQVGLIEFNSSVNVISSLGTAPDQVRRSASLLKPGGQTAWRDAVLSALDTLAQYNGRRNVILVTDGQDNSSRQSLHAVSDRAKQLQIPVCAIGLGSAGEVDEGEMRQLAEETGGQYMLMPGADRLAQLYRQLGEASREEIAVTYRSTRPSPDGTRRSIEVIIHSPTGIIRGQGGYLERHLLNIESNPVIFMVVLLVIGGAYLLPLVLDRNVRVRERRARAEAFALPVEPAARVAPPTITLNAHSHPIAVPVDYVERAVSVRLDVTAASSPGTEFRFQPLYVVALLDMSASMEGERLGAAVAALNSLVDGLGESDCFCLIGFSHEPKLIVPPVRAVTMRQEISRRLKDLAPGTSTLLAPALEMLREQVPDDVGGRKTYALLVSDGKVEDMSAAEAARASLPPNVAFSAFGIGTDYDHELLSRLCGGKNRVDHLESAAEAAGAFEHFIALYGHTLTARTSLRLSLTAGTRALSLTSLLHARPILPPGGADAMAGNTSLELPVDNVPVGGPPSSYLLEMVMSPTVPGTMPLGEVALRYDLPGYRLSEQSTSVHIFVEVSSDPTRAGVANPQVVRMIKSIQATRLMESAEEDLRTGKAQRATHKLRSATRRLEEHGEVEKAKTVAQLADQIERNADTDPDQSIKRVRGATKRVTE